MSASESEDSAFSSKADKETLLCDEKPQSVESTLTYAANVSRPKPKVSKPSVLPTFLPPCRVCNAKASGFHYGMSQFLSKGRSKYVSIIIFVTKLPSPPLLPSLSVFSTLLSYHQHLYQILLIPYGCTLTLTLFQCQ